MPPALRARLAADAATAAAAAAAKPAEAAKPGAYVPPSMRNRAPEASGSYEIPSSSVNYRRPNKSQPNLNDCLEFPSLDAAGADAATPATQSDERYDMEQGLI